MNIPNNAKLGIDISANNGSINWNKVKSSGVNFAMIKATQGHSIVTNSYLFTDSKFKTNIIEASASGIICGTYHYFTAKTPAESLKEADYFISVINSQKHRLKLYAAIDVEEPKYLNSLSREELTNVVNIFCERVKSAGYNPIIYTNPNFLQYKLDDISKWNLWLAKWTSNKTKPNYPNLRIWQHEVRGTTQDVQKGYATVKGIVGGVNGAIDVNYGYFDAMELVPPNPSNPCPIMPEVALVKVGDTVKVKVGSVYGGLSSARGRDVPAWVCGKQYRVSQIKAIKGSTEALLNPLNSWVGVDDIKRV